MEQEKTPPRLPLVALVASVRGFVDGRMIEPGQTFMWDPNSAVPGVKRDFPLWAAPPGQQAVKQSPANPALGYGPRMVSQIRTK